MVVMTSTTVTQECSRWSRRGQSLGAIVYYRPIGGQSAEDGRGLPAGRPIPAAAASCSLEAEPKELMRLTMYTIQLLLTVHKVSTYIHCRHVKKFFS